MSKALEKIDWELAESSNLQATYFHPESKQICVKFHNGGLYTYSGVDDQIYSGLIHSSSMGRYLNNVLRQFPYKRHESEHTLISYLNI